MAFYNRVDILSKSWNLIESWIFDASDMIIGNKMSENSLIYA